MNHTYRLVWSDDAQRCLPAPESSRGRGKGRSRARALKALAPAVAILGATLSLPGFAQAPPGADALPSGGQVVYGNASIGQSGNQMTVAQTSNKAILNWNSFNIGQDAAVRFVQPGSDAIALNRVIGGDGSQVLGSLSSNGQVWLVNPNGIVFGQGSQVDVGGLVASTLNIADQDFIDGKAVFTRDGATGGIVNSGHISASDGGVIALLAPSVSNDGVLTARLGTVAMAAGDQVTLAAGADGLLQVQVEPSTIQTLVANRQLIVADGGQVVMTGKAADALAASVVANSGTVQARTLAQKEGRILLLGDMTNGTVEVGGTLDASAPAGQDGNGGDGGWVETSAAHVAVAADTQVTTLAADGQTGNWLIDPTNFTIGAGSGAQTTSGIGADTLSANLGQTNVTLATVEAGDEAGDINVNAAVAWDADTKLTLIADGDIKINADIRAGGDLELRAQKGISQEASALQVKGETTLSASGDITLSSSNNVFGKAVNLQKGLNASISSQKALYLGTVNVGSLTASAPELWLPASINTSGLQSYAGQVRLAQDTALTSQRGQIDIDGKVDGAHALTLSANASIVLSGDVGSETALASLNVVNGPELQLSGKVTTSGDQSYGTAVNLTGDATFTSTSGDISFAQVVNGEQRLAVDAPGSVSFAGAIGATNALSSLSVSAGSARVQSGLTTTGGLTITTASDGISQHAAWTVGGASRLDAGSQAISLDNTGNDFGGVMHLSGGAVSVHSAGDLTVASLQSGAGQDVSLTSGGALTLPLSGIDTQGGSLTLDAGDLISAEGSVSVGTFTLTNGTWVQNGASLPGFSASDFRLVGGSFLRAAGGDGTADNPYRIADVFGLQGLGTRLQAHYTLAGDIDAGGSANWWSGKGFQPIGDRSNRFTGSLDGADHVIRDLSIQSDQQYAGLFGAVSGASLLNLGLQNASVTSSHDDGNVGALAGSAEATRVSHVWSSGSVTSYNRAGGLLAYMTGSTLTDSHSTSTVTATYIKPNGTLAPQVAQIAGGLVGSMSAARIEDSWSSGTVTANGLIEADAGGLVGGEVLNGTISGSYASAQVTAKGSVNVAAVAGGLVGSAYGLDIVNSYSTSGLSGSGRFGYLGGLLGRTEALHGLTTYPVTIRNSYAAPFSISWATAVSAASGGLVGQAHEQTQVTASFWSLISSATGNGLGDVDALSGYKTPTELTRLSTFADAGWDMDDAGGTDKVWRIYDGKTGPLLRSFLTVLDVGVWLPSGKTYDGSIASGAANGYSYTPGITPTPGLLSGSLNYATTSANAGTYSVGDGGLTLGGLYSSQQGYDIRYFPDTALTIGKASLSVSTTDVSKTYDGTASAAGSLVVTGGQLFGTDSISGGDFAFADKNAGTDKTVAVSGVTVNDGNGGGNYDISYVDNTNSRIDKLAINGSITASDKVYDASTSTSTSTSLSGVVEGDDVTVASSGSFSDKNVGIGKTVNVAGTVTGADADNYDVTLNSSTTANIAVRAITASIVASDKIYDGSTTASTSGSLDGVLAGDDLTIVSTRGSFDDKNAGTGKTVTVAIGGLAGADAGNYTVSYHTETTADIVKRTVQGNIVADNKVYDGSTIASTTGSLSGVVVGDDLTVASTSGSFSDKNAGTGKTVTVAGTVAGADAGNYDVAFNSRTTADIAKLAINGNIAASDKTYDGSTIANTSGSLSGVLAGDDLTVASTSGSFSNKNAGTGKTVTVAGTVAGTDAGNYDVAFNNTTTADIAKLGINGSITASDKIYDGSTIANTRGSLNGVLAGDDLAVASTSGSFSDKNAGVGKTVAVTGTVVGTDAGNYDVAFNSSTTADIAKLAINGSIVADNKTYDGSTVAVTSGSLSGVLTGDDLTVANTSGQFADPNVGTGKTVAVTGVVTGADAGNYDVTFNTTTTADIASELPASEQLVNGQDVWRAVVRPVEAPSVSPSLAAPGTGNARRNPYLALAPDFIRLEP